MLNTFLLQGPSKLEEKPFTAANLILKTRVTLSHGSEHILKLKKNKCYRDTNTLYKPSTTNVRFSK